MLATYREKSWIQRHKLLVLMAYVAFVFVYGAAFGIFGRFLPVYFGVPILFGVVAIVALLPLSDRAPNRALTPMLFILVVVVCTWPDYLAIALPALPWITLLRLISFPLALLLLIDLSSSRIMRQKLHDDLMATRAAYVCLVGLVIIAGLTVGLSKNLLWSLNRYGIFLLTQIVPILVAVHVFRKPGSVTTFARIMLFVTILACLIAVEEVRLHQLPWVGHIPSFLAVEDESVQRVLSGQSRAGTGIYRAQSRFTTSLGLGEFLGLTLPFILHIVFSRGAAWLRILGAATLPLVLWVVIQTDSRLAAIGLLGSCMMYLLASAVLRWRNRSDSIFGPAITVGYPAIFLTFMAGTFVSGRLRNMVWGDGSTTPSNEARKTMYNEGIPIVLHNPFGHGIGMSGGVLGYHSPTGVLTIDTYYLAVALDWGVLGFLFYYGLFLILIAKGAFSVLNLRDREAVYLIPASMALVNFVVSKSVFSNSENHALVFVIAGIAFALLKRNADADAARLKDEQRAALGQMPG